MRFQPLTDFLDYYLPMLGIPGSDTSVWVGREEVYRHTTGFDSIRMGTPLRSDAIYKIFSATKISTCTSILQLVERGEIVLTDPLYAYFPEFRNMKVKRTLPDGTVEITDAKKPILIRHLLSMTSGLNYDVERPGIQRCLERTDGMCSTLEFVRSLAEDPLEFEPGDKFLYGLSHDVLGGIVELVSGKKLGEYMKENIFDPLGMKDTGFSLPEEKAHRLAAMYNYDTVAKCAVELEDLNIKLLIGPNVESGGGGLYSTVDDYVLLVDALTHLGLGKTGNRILTERAVELMRTNQLTPEQLDEFGIPPQNTGYGYGYGVRTNMNPHLSGNLASKGAFGWDGAKLAFFSSDPEKKISFYHAEHMGSLFSVVEPRLMNLIYSALGY